MRPRPLRSPAGAPRWLTPTDQLVACHASIGAHALAMGQARAASPPAGLCRPRPHTPEGEGLGPLHYTRPPKRVSHSPAALTRRHGTHARTRPPATPRHAPPTPLRAHLGLRGGTTSSRRTTVNPSTASPPYLYTRRDDPVSGPIRDFLSVKRRIWASLVGQIPFCRARAAATFAAFRLHRDARPQPSKKTTRKGHRRSAACSKHMYTSPRIKKNKKIHRAALVVGGWVGGWVGAHPRRRAHVHARARARTRTRRRPASGRSARPSRAASRRPRSPPPPPRARARVCVCVCVCVCRVGPTRRSRSCACGGARSTPLGWRRGRA